MWLTCWLVVCRQVLTAAFRHADDETRRALQACRDGMAGLRQALDTVQASVRALPPSLLCLAWGGVGGAVNMLADEATCVFGR